MPLAVDVARTAAGLVDPGWVGTYRDEVDAIYSRGIPRLYLERKRIGRHISSQ